MKGRGLAVFDRGPCHTVALKGNRMQYHLQCNGGEGVGLLKYPALLCNEHHQVQLHKFYLLSLFSLCLFGGRKGTSKLFTNAKGPGKITVKDRTFVFCTHCLSNCTSTPTP